MPDPEATPADLAQLLAAPFAPDEVKFKPQAVKGNRALALAYVDARVIMDRLDQVLGVDGWQDHYRLLPENSVMCRLRLRLGDRWVTKADVGSPSEQPDEGDRMKAGFSDALKRAAVKFGIGRYLYRLPQQWADYDPQKRQFVSPPALPDWARPKGAPTPARAPAAKAAAGSGLPATGAELLERLQAADADLAAKGLCPRGSLLGHVIQAGVKAGFGNDISAWAGPAIELAAAEAKKFKGKLPRKAA